MGTGGQGSQFIQDLLDMGPGFKGIAGRCNTPAGFHEERVAEGLA